MADGANRPLSPHLQIYRPQISSVLSITHRATGVALSVGTVVLVWWLVAAAAGPGPYAWAAGFIHSWLGTLMMLGWSWSIFYHLLAGVRHLAWDAGYGFDLPMVDRTGWIVVYGSAGLTVLSWIVAAIVA